MNNFLVKEHYTQEEYEEHFNHIKAILGGKEIKKLKNGMEYEKNGSFEFTVSLILKNREEEKTTALCYWFFKGNDGWEIGHFKDSEQIKQNRIIVERVPISFAQWSKELKIHIQKINKQQLKKKIESL